MCNEIRIAKHLCERVENQWQSVLEVRCLPDTQLAGYKIDVPAWLIKETAEYFAVVQPRKNDFVFEAVKVERDPGKRYARPKLTFDELQAVFSDHSRQFDYSLLPQALVFLKDYSNNHRRTAGTVESTRYCVGGTDGTWFYDGENRRRLGTHGAVLMKMLEPEEVQPMQAKIDRLADLDTALAIHRGFNEQYHKAADNLKDCLTDKRSHLRALASEATLDNAAKLLADLEALIAVDVAASKAECDELKRFFETLLPKNA